MKHKTIEIFLFIDALGWEIVKRHDFLSRELPCRKKISMQFGYSSSAVPTILSGTRPAEHGHLGLFRFAPEESPFKLFSRLAFLFKPESFWNRGRVRHHLSKILKKIYGFTGYFQLYRMPVKKLKYMDYCEKKNLFVSGGMDNVKNLHDTLSGMKIDFHISDWHLNDDQNYAAAGKAIEEGKNFLFVYTASLDGLLHDHVRNNEIVARKLDRIAEQVRHLYAKAEEYAETVHFNIISDHGMTPLTGTVDMMTPLEKEDLVFGKDYGVCFDSTMTRFYYLTPKAEQVIPALLEKYQFPGHLLLPEEEKKYGIYRADRMFGDAIFLLDPGIQSVPSDMGSKPLNGMHGFSPEDRDSYAALLANTPIPENIRHVADYFNLMIERANLL